MELEVKLTELTTEMTSFTAKAKEEIKNLGATTTETKTAVDGIRAQITALQTQLDAVDAKTQIRHTGGEPEVKSAGQKFTEAPEFVKESENGAFNALRRADGRIRFPMNESLFSNRKSVITTGTVGTGTTGVQMPMRLPGIAGLPMQELRIRDLMSVIPMTTGNSFDYAKQSGRTNMASPQVESSPKSESTYAWIWCRERSKPSRISPTSRVRRLTIFRG